MKLRLIAALFFLIPMFVQAQVKEQTGWLALNNAIKFNKKWGMHLDVQFRSVDNLDYLRNLLFRPGVTYYINSKTNVTAGYLYTLTNNRLAGLAKNQLTENRIWQQFIYNQPIKSTVLTHRFRLEQRFIERQSDNIFSQRLRYMARAVIPLAKQDSSFKKGLFVGLQDEIFVNVQNRDEINGSFFDQNRAYLALGYRVSKKFDIETGYLVQSINGRTTNTTNNVVQLALYTRF